MRPISGWGPTVLDCRVPTPIDPSSRLSTLTMQSAMLVDSVSHRNGVACGDVLTVGVKIAPPLTLIVPFKAAVEPGAEVEACRRHRLYPVGALDPVWKHSTNRAAEQSAVVVFEAQFGDDIQEGLDSSIRELESPLEHCRSTSPVR